MVILQKLLQRRNVVASFTWPVSPGKLASVSRQSLDGSEQLEIGFCIVAHLSFFVSKCLCLKAVLRIEQEQRHRRCHKARLEHAGKTAANLYRYNGLYVMQWYCNHERK